MTPSGPCHVFTDDWTNHDWTCLSSESRYVPDFDEETGELKTVIRIYARFSCDNCGTEITGTLFPMNTPPGFATEQELEEEMV